MLEIAAEHLLPAMLSEIGEYAVRSASRAALEAHAGRRRGLHQRITPAPVAPVDGETVLSSVPGRLRIRVPSLRGDVHRAREAEARVGALPGVRRTQANTLTGSLLVEYDPSLPLADRIFACLLPRTRTWQAS